jgi:alkaline phosphatase D
MERRTFLRLGLGGAALVATQPILGRDPALAQPAPGPFGHGVASGDPLPDGVVIWTRITPSVDATPGSGLGAPTAVTWAVATDEAFTEVVATGSVTTDPASDHTVKVDVDGLAAATEHHYRFTALGATSPVGRTRTAPATGSDAQVLRFGVASCSNYEGGFFSAYRHLADRDDLDAVLHLGDYLYEYGVGTYGSGGPERVHDPATEILSLSDYRRRHALHKTDPDLARLHQRYAFVTTIDDHEVTNDAHAAGAENHDPATEGDYLERRAAAMQAYFEWMPIRATGGAAEPTRIYRQLGFGGLAEIFMLDERTYRSPQPEGISEALFVTSGEPAEDGRTMLGADQGAFLDDGLRASTARWKLIGNGVMFAPLVLADLTDLGGAADQVATLLDGLGVPLGAPIVVNGDQWDGYQDEQRSVGSLYGEVGGVVILTGDIHSSWAAEIPADPGSYLPVAGGETVAVEFVTPAVTSDGFSQSVGDALPGAEGLGTLLPAVVTTAGPWFKYLEPDQQGYGVFEVTAEHAQYDWHFISDRLDPQATSTFAAAYETLSGTNKLRQAAQLGPRADQSPLVVVPAPAAPPPAATAPDPARAGGGTLPATGTEPPLAPAAAAVAAAAGLAAVARRARPTEEVAP